MDYKQTSPVQNGDTTVRHQENIFATNGKSHELVSLCNKPTESTFNSHVNSVINQPDDHESRCLDNWNKAITSGHIFFKKLLPVLILVGWLVFIGFAIYLNSDKVVFVCVITPFVAYITINKVCQGTLSRGLGRVWKAWRKCFKPSKKIKVWTRRLLTVVLTIGIFIFLIIDVWDEWEKWIPLGGLAFFIFVSVIFSKKPSKINWIPVIWGIMLQFGMGLLILRWRLGFTACQFVGRQLTIFLHYTDKGTSFVFGEKYIDHPIVFKILPVVVFFSSIVSILYYIGAMQAVIKAIAFVIQYTLGTTPIESFATAAHIFIGSVESSVVLKPFWSLLTESELHAIMTSGFATVAGTIIAAYVEFGVPAEHVIAASFMSAPAALAIAKISIPETETSKIRTQKEIQLPSGQETNMLEALSVGAQSAIKLIAYVVVNIIAFIAIVAFLDAVLSYLGGLVNIENLNFQTICSYVFMPLAAIIGIPWVDARVVGSLIGKKIVLNEFLAYIDLGAMIKEGVLQERSVVLATYILCGFGSVAAIGINLGCLVSNCPDKRSDFARLSVRSMVNGNIACFMTACIAGLLYQVPSSHDMTEGVLNSTLINITETTTAITNITTIIL